MVAGKNTRTARSRNKQVKRKPPASLRGRRLLFPDMQRTDKFQANYRRLNGYSVTLGTIMSLPKVR